MSLVCLITPVVIIVPRLGYGSTETLNCPAPSPLADPLPLSDRRRHRAVVCL